MKKRTKEKDKRNVEENKDDKQYWVNGNMPLSLNK
jgi:hypothetical protein